MSIEVSPRQQLDQFVGSGRLREMAEKARLSDAATELLVNVVARYCQPRKRK